MVESPVENAYRMEIEVVEGDIDVLGHVGNSVPIRWMNEAAWGHSKALGYDLEGYRRLGGWFVVKRFEVEYQTPGYLGERLIGFTWPDGLWKATARRRHLIVKEGDGEVVAEGMNVWAYVDVETGRPRRIPEELRNAFDPRKFPPV